jgi:hypothetical protein
MQTPLVFRAILGLLMDLTIPGALGAFVLAGMRLRSEGGMNFEASGGFLKWMFWGCVLLSIPSISSWLGAEGIPGASQLSQAGATGAAYTAGIERVTGDFVDNFLVGHVVPVVAASLHTIASRGKGMGSILFHAFPQEVVDSIAARTNGLRTQVESRQEKVIVAVEGDCLFTVRGHSKQFLLRLDRQTKASRRCGTGRVWTRRSFRIWRAYLWHVHHGGDEEHLCCGRFHRACGPEVNAAISAPGIGAIA